MGTAGEVLRKRLSKCVQPTHYENPNQNGLCIFKECIVHNIPGGVSGWGRGAVSIHCIFVKNGH